MKEKLLNVLRFLFATRKRAFWSVTSLLILIIGGAIGVKIINNRLDFRAFDEPPSTTTETGLDYVEDVTMRLFSQELTNVPADQLSDYDEVAMITDLAGQNYFRLNLATERQTFLNSWQPEVASWKTFAQTAESAPTGAWPWLEWLKPYCNQGDGGDTGFNIIERAQAQVFNPDKCPAVQKSLFDPTKSKIYTFAELEIMKTFSLKWRGFHDQASSLCRESNMTPIYCDKVALYSKSYWSPANLNILYSKGNALGSFKSSRNKAFFSQAEVKQVTSHERIAWLMQLKLDDEVTTEQMKELRATAINVMLSALPVERPLAVIGGAAKKAVGLGLGVLKKAPIPISAPITSIEYVAIKTSLQISRGAATVVNIVLRKPGLYLSKVSLNLSEWYGKSKIPSYLRAPNSAKTLREEVATKIFETTAEYTSDKTMIDAFAKIGVSQQEVAAKAVKIFQNSKAYSVKNFAITRKTPLGQECIAVACANYEGNFIKYNEDYLMHGIYSITPGGATRSIIDVKPIERIASVVFHENNHLLINRSSDLSLYSTVLGRSPLEEGAVEWNAQRLAKKYGYDIRNPYVLETSWYDEVVAAIGRGQKKGVIKLTGTPEQVQADCLYAYGGEVLDKLLSDGVPKGSPVKSVLGISFSRFDSKRPHEAIDLIMSLYR